MAFKSCTSTPEFFDSFLACPPRNEVLRRLGTLLDWDALREVVAAGYKDIGRVGFDPVVLIKLLLLERLYGLSDVQVVAEAADRLSFREFLGLRAGDAVPDDTTLVKFRARLRHHGLLEPVMQAVEQQLAVRGVKVREGHIKIVDATLIEAAVGPPPRETKRHEEQGGALDPDADWTRKRGRPHYGYKLHAAQDRSTGLITGHEVTPASVHDSRVFEQFLGQGEGEVLADKGYDSREHRRMCAALGAKASIQKRADSQGRLSAWWKTRNVSIGRVRGFIEGTFGQLKRYLGCGRARYRGLIRVGEQMAWGVLAFNLKRAVAMLYGQPVRRRKRRAAVGA